MLAHRGAGAAACAGGVIVPVSADAWLCTTAGHRDLNAAHLSAHDADRGSEPVVRQLLTLLLLLLRSCQRRCARLQGRRSLQPAVNVAPAAPTADRAAVRQQYTLDAAGRGGGGAQNLRSLI